MQTIDLYGLANCSSCRNARKWLAAHGIEVRFADYRAVPIAADTLIAWAGRLGWDRLINRRSPTWRSLDDKEKAAASDAEWTALVAAHPTLLKRPVAAWPDGRVQTGFSDALYAEWFGT